jgi:DUF1365 family protein
MYSSLYFGEVRHQRKSPKKHAFKYNVFMCHLFLDEIMEIFKRNWFWSVNQKNLSSYYRSDYHKPETSDLAQAVQSTMSEQLGRSIEGPVFHHYPPSYLWLLFQPGFFLLLLESRENKTPCHDGGDYQYPLA